MRILPVLIVSAAVLAQQVAFASPESAVLGECLKDNTSGKDRKDLARWIFIAMSVHPEIRSLSTATDATRKEADQQMADLVTRLLTQNCPAQARAAIEKGGPDAMMDSFRTLGEVAMMELTSDASVKSSLSSYAQLLDRKKFEAIMSPTK